NPRQLEVDCMEDLLMGLAFIAREHRPQILVPRNDDTERVFNLSDVQNAADLYCSGNVVAGTMGRELVQEPQSFLSEAQRQPLELRPVDRYDGRNGIFLCLGDPLGQFSDAAALKQQLERQVHAELAANLRDQPGRQQRMATQLEEIV